MRLISLLLESYIMIYIESCVKKAREFFVLREGRIKVCILMIQWNKKNNYIIYVVNKGCVCNFVFKRIYSRKCIVFF